MLAVVTAVDRANTHAVTPQGLLDGFHPALVVSVAAALLGAVAVAARLPRRRAVLIEADAPEIVPEAEAA